MKTLLIAVLAVLTRLSGFAADGIWTSLSDGNWSDSSKWLNGVIANGDDSSAVMQSGVKVTPNQDVSLHEFIVKAPIFSLNSSSGNVFTMKNNPLIKVDPFPSRGLGITLNQLITGDGSVLTIKGGNINLESLSGITNFSRVDVMGVATLSPRYSRPVTDGDLRVSDSRINNNSQQATGYLVAGGKLIVGPAWAECVSYGLYGGNDAASGDRARSARHATVYTSKWYPYVSRRRISADERRGPSADLDVL